MYLEKKPLSCYFCKKLEEENGGNGLKVFALVWGESL